MDGDTTTRRWRFGGAIAACCALALIALLPPDSPPWVAVSLVTEGVALIVLLLAAWRMPPRARLVWWSLGLYAALTVAADVTYDILQYHLGVSPFPSLADALYLAAYVPEVVALIVLMRQRQRVWDRQAWIDSAVILLAAVSIAVTFVLAPMASQSSPSDLTTYLALTYPLLDLLVLAILIRLAVGGGRPMTSLILLMASVVLTLTADLVYNGLAIAGVVDQAPGWLEAAYIAGIVLLAAAATDPQAGAIGRPAPRQAGVMSAPRTIALGLGALTAPVLLAVGTIDKSSPEVFFLAVASIAVNVLVIWRILLLMSTVQRQSDRLALLSRTDALTELPNRRSWDFEMQRAAETAASQDLALTVAIADIDHFKEFNDAQGHPAGDALLAACARSWRAHLDPAIVLARYGGEEFALLLPGPHSEAAASTLDAMRLATPAPVTVSVGYATHIHGEAIEDTVERADEALYRAKDAGRNRVAGAARTATDRAAQSPNELPVGP